MCFKRCWRTGKITGELFISGNRSSVFWKTEVPPNTIISEKLVYDIDKYREKVKLWYPGQYMHEYTYEDSIQLFSSTKTPWLWIGDGKTDVSSEVDKYIVPGNIITIDMLREINSSIRHWIYCDFKTLEIVDFPSNGFIINDSFLKEDTKKE
jgi:hypothetical protein